MMRGNRSLRGSQPPSPSGSEDDNDPAKSPISDAGMEDKTPSRGRQGKIDKTEAMDVGA